MVFVTVNLRDRSFLMCGSNKMVDLKALLCRKQVGKALECPLEPGKYRTELVCSDQPGRYLEGTQFQTQKCFSKDD